MVKFLSLSLSLSLAELDSRGAGHCQAHLVVVVALVTNVRQASTLLCCLARLPSCWGDVLERTTVGDAAGDVCKRERVRERFLFLLWLILIRISFFASLHPSRRRPLMKAKKMRK